MVRAVLATANGWSGAGDRMAYGIGFLIVALATACLWWMRHFYREINAHRAHELFHLQREMLEAKFAERAYEVRAPSEPRWKACDFDEDSFLGRNQATGELVALVEITIHYELEDLVRQESDTIGAHRQGSAVFRFHRGRWQTSGEVLLDVNPREALATLGTNFRAIDFAESDHRSR